MAIYKIFLNLCKRVYQSILAKDKKITNKIKGPFAYENWKAFRKGKFIEAFEYPLYTDAWIVGEISEGLGPYELINTVPHRNQRRHRPSLILRSAEFTNRETPAMSKTDDQRYHGGLLSDEIASLISLSLGIRMKSGGATRMFDSSGDPRGRPTEGWGYGDIPIVPDTSEKPVLPNSRGQHDISDAKILSSLPNMTPRQAIALVRAARLYQEAMWMSDTAPELSWLMFVSAIETAAGEWREEKDSPIEKLRTSRPELERLLKQYGEEELVEKVAEIIAPYMGATKTFEDFALEYLPPPPKIRPAEAFQHSWDKKAMKASLGKIYKYRSRALHGGTPFPAPMCEAPDRLSDDIDLEIPTGLASSSLGAVWVAKDTPMLLHTFEYIVRNVLIAWWTSITSQIK